MFPFPRRAASVFALGGLIVLGACAADDFTPGDAPGGSGTGGLAGSAAGGRGGSIAGAAGTGGRGGGSSGSAGASGKAGGAAEGGRGGEAGESGAGGVAAGGAAGGAGASGAGLSGGGQGGASGGGAGGKAPGGQGGVAGALGGAAGVPGAGNGGTSSGGKAGNGGASPGGAAGVAGAAGQSGGGAGGGAGGANAGAGGADAGAGGAGAGAGGAPTCGTCPDPVDICGKSACIEGKCSIVASGVVPPATPGDCKLLACVGTETKEDIDTADVPAPLGTCDVPSCQQTEPAHTNDDTKCEDGTTCVGGRCCQACGVALDVGVPPACATPANTHALTESNPGQAAFVLDGNSKTSWDAGHPGTPSKPVGIVVDLPLNTYLSSFTLIPHLPGPSVKASIVFTFRFVQDGVVVFETTRQATKQNGGGLEVRLPSRLLVDQIDIEGVGEDTDVAIAEVGLRDCQ